MKRNGAPPKNMTKKASTRAIVPWVSLASKPSWTHASKATTTRRQRWSFLPWLNKLTHSLEHMHCGAVPYVWCVRQNVKINDTERTIQRNMVTKHQYPLPIQVRASLSKHLAQKNDESQRNVQSKCRYITQPEDRTRFGKQNALRKRIAGSGTRHKPRQKNQGRKPPGQPGLPLAAKQTLTVQRSHRPLWITLS